MPQFMSLVIFRLNYRIAQRPKSKTRQQILQTRTRLTPYPHQSLLRILKKLSLVIQTKILLYSYVIYLNMVRTLVFTNKIPPGFQKIFFGKFYQRFHLATQLVLLQLPLRKFSSFTNWTCTKREFGKISHNFAFVIPKIWVKLHKLSHF